MYPVFQKQKLLMILLEPLGWRKWWIYWHCQLKFICKILNTYLSSFKLFVKIYHELTCRKSIYLQFKLCVLLIDYIRYHHHHHMKCSYIWILYVYLQRTSIKHKIDRVVVNQAKNNWLEKLIGSHHHQHYHHCFVNFRFTCVYAYVNWINKCEEITDKLTDFFYCVEESILRRKKNKFKLWIMVFISSAVLGAATGTGTNPF